MITCCYNCSDRHVGCHGNCSKYIKQKEEHDAEAKWLKKENRCIWKATLRIHQNWQ